MGRHEAWSVETQLGDAEYEGLGILRLSGVSKPMGVDARRTIEDPMEQLFEEGVSSVIVDCEGLEWITPDAVGALLQDVHRLRAAGGDLVLLGVPARVREFLAGMGLADKVRFFDEPLDAVADKLAGELERKRKLRPKRCFLSAEKVGDVSLVVVKGAIDRAGLPRFASAVKKALAASSSVLIDGTDLLSASSGSFATFVKLTDEARQAGKTLALVVTGPVREFVNVLELDAFLRPFSDRRAALASLARDSKGPRKRRAKESKGESGA
jgi:anti-anti-sigma factor